jgi:hypothetical protein
MSRPGAPYFRSFTRAAGRPETGAAHRDGGLRALAPSDAALLGRLAAQVAQLTLEHDSSTPNAHCLVSSGVVRHHLLLAKEGLAAAPGQSENHSARMHAQVGATIDSERV